ncbi:MAG: endonuclease domain-containing protein [Pseudomonadota bacterium]
MSRIERARRLRRNQTEVERRLWNALRDRRFEGLKFRRQMPVEGYIAGFLCADAKLIVELDGGQHAEQRQYDKERTETLRRAGFHVVRFWNNEVMENVEGVLSELRSVLNR